MKFTAHPRQHIYRSPIDLIQLRLGKQAKRRPLPEIKFIFRVCHLSSAIRHLHLRYSPCSTRFAIFRLPNSEFNNLSAVICSLSSVF